MQVRRPLLVTDLDNTLYDWIEYFARRLRGMIHAGALKAGLDEACLEASFKRLFRRHGTLEYPLRQVTELDVLAGVSEEEGASIRRAMYSAFRGVTNKRLVLYEGVEDLLGWCSDQTIPVIALTNAPVEVVQERFAHLHLQSFFSGVVAPFMNDSKARRAVEQLECGGMFRGTPGNPRVHLLEDDELKPSGSGYERVLEEWDGDPSDIFVLGDSLEKDLRPASELGCSTIWARYGTGIRPADLETLFAVTPWSGEQVATAYGHHFSPNWTVDAVSEVRGILSAT